MAHHGLGALLPSLAITTAVSAHTTTPVVLDQPPSYVAVQANFTYGSSGTSVDAWLQTSLDQGVTWIDIANFHFTTSTARKVSALTKAVALSAATAPTDGSLTANTILNGCLGDRFRIKYTTVGTYAGGTVLDVQAVSG